MSIEERALQQSADWPDQLILGAGRARGLITFETGQRDVSEDEAEGKLAWYCFWETAPIYTVSSVEVADKADNA